MSAALRWRLFLAAALGINLTAFFLAHQVAKPPVAYGAAFDVAVTVPLLYFWLVVRAGLQPAITLVPLFLVALIRATYVAPGLGWMRPVIGACAELAVLTVLTVRVRRGLRVAGTGGDFLERVGLAASEVVPVAPAAELLAAEIAVLYFALGSWRSRPFVPAGARAFSIHERSSAGILFSAIGGLCLVESAVAHVVIQRWSVAAAWILTALSLYSALWLAAIARSFAMRPILVGGGELVVRNGMLHTLQVPLVKIKSVGRGSGDGAWCIPPLTDANVVVEFREVVTARGLYGLKRRVTQVALSVDDPEGFEAALNRTL
ncbi:MAG TPA: hypothetical protein VMH81_26100 [Bryobacteraceae bacterium]|nr:hypothetical protein [Bryobacteraceae bacterium]